MSECAYCRAQNVETRMGCCWDCATSGEERAARRTVWQHISKAFDHALDGLWGNVRIDLSWAWERLTTTGDYPPQGYFDHQVPDWRTPPTHPDSEGDDA